MNKYEQALVDAVRQITKDNAAKAASDARWLNGMLRDLAPQMIGQREYKMLTALLNCEGNRILAEAAKKPAAARDAEVERLVRRLCDEYVMDEDAARRICALYLAGVTGDDAFVTADDRRKAKPEPTPAPKPAPKPAPAPTPKSAPAVPPTPKTAPSSTPKPAPAPAPTPKPAAKPAPAPAAEPKPQKTPGAPRLKLKKRHLRFVPMAIAMLGGYFVFGSALANADLESLDFAAADITRMKVFCAVYILAAIYCYIIAFPFDELFQYRRGWFCRVKAVIGDLVGDIWMALMSMPMGVAFTLVAGAADEVGHVEGGIWRWLAAIGLMLLLVFAIGLMLYVGFSAHASPKKEEAELPGLEDWVREDGNAVKVMYAISCAMVLAPVVRALIGV